MRYQEGPVSKRKPSAAQLPTRPPVSDRRSTTVTSRPSRARSAAVAKPAIPPPAMTTGPSDAARGCPPDDRRVTGWSGQACAPAGPRSRSEEHTSELQSRFDLVCRLLLEKKKK